MDQLSEAALKLNAFQGASLTKTIAQIEKGMTGLGAEDVQMVLQSKNVDHGLLKAALDFKRVAGQINVVIHAIGIMLLLPKILEPGEIVESMSIGAGNTGKKFDLETNKMVAEFKFIQWRGGPEAIRQNAFFKDLYLLVEHETSKKKKVFLTGASYPMKFLQSKRSLLSILSRHVGLTEEFKIKYGDKLKAVREYYELKKTEIEIVDVLDIIPNFKIEEIEEAALY